MVAPDNVDLPHGPPLCHAVYHVWPELDSPTATR